MTGTPPAQVLSHGCWPHLAGEMGERRKEGNLSTTQVQRERSPKGHWREQGCVSSDLGNGSCQERRAGEAVTRTKVLMPW